MTKLKNLLKVLILLQVSVALSKGKTRIVGGTPTTIDKAPYLVQIRNDGSILCGGALVSETDVVTAAHCFDDKPVRLSVVAGATRLTDAGISSKVKKIMIPTTYNSETFHTDIAVVKLRSPLRGASVRPVNISLDNWNTADPVKIFGWGKRVEDADNIPIQLHSVDVNVVNQNSCARTYRSRQPITDSMFCAAAPGKDACSGDSGGPVIVHDKLCGVVSWGIGCAREDSPGVYTNVTKYVGFIQSAMQK